jgi:hypothetical protein
MLRLNFMRRTHPVNVARKKQLLEKLVADYHPSTTMLMSSCEHLAGILEQLEVLKAGSQEHKRLVELSQLLAASLEVSRPATAAPTTPTDLDEDELIERTTTMLRSLLELRDEAKRSAEMRAGYCHPDGVDGSPFADGAGQDAPVLAGAAPAGVPLAEPTRCPYCGQAPCVGPEHSAFEVLHWDDPEEVDRRAKAATAEMIESLRRQRTWR